MNFLKYLLSSACIGILSISDGGAAFSGEDPAIQELKDAIKKLSADVVSLQSTLDEVKGQVEKSETENKTIVDDIKTKVTNAENSIADTNKSLAALEKSSKDSNKTIEEISAIKKELKKTKEGIASLANNNGDEKIKKLEDTIISMAQKLDEDKSAEMAKNAETTKANETQKLEMAKIVAQIEKIQNQLSKDKAKSAAGGGLAFMQNGGLDLLKSGSGLLNGLISKKPNTNGEKISSDQQTTAAIEKAVKNGKLPPTVLAQIASGQPLPADVINTISNEILANDSLNDNTFQKVIFYGVNPIFKEKAIITRILNQARGQRDINALIKSLNDIAKTPLTANDEDIIKTVFEMVKQNATIHDIIDNITLVYSGSPSKTVTPSSTPDPASEILSQQPAANPVMNMASGFLGKLIPSQQQQQQQSTTTTAPQGQQQPAANPVMNMKNTPLDNKTISNLIKLNNEQNAILSELIKPVNHKR